MNVTGEYYLCRQTDNNDGLTLHVSFNGLSNMELYLPNVNLLCKSNRYMAIEKNRFRHDDDLKFDINKITGNNKTCHLEVNRGRIEASYVSDNKSELSMIPGDDGKEILNLVMIIPSWGRRTAKRLWLIIVK